MHMELLFGRRINHAALGVRVAKPISHPCLDGKYCDEDQDCEDDGDDIGVVSQRFHLGDESST